ncbi:MAG: hypothetical protein WA405_01600 [Candidatus Acidiferrales bacterium]
MPRRISAFLLLAAAMGAALISSACGGNSSGSTSTANVTAVAITPSATTDVPINTSFDFTATVTLSDSSVSTTTAVTWYVNGIAGGDLATVGSIVPLNTDNQVGVYTAPGFVPTTNNGQVNITATAQQSSSCTTNCTITSNTVVVQITVVLGITVTPAAVNVPAGGEYKFTALENGLPDPNATWAVSSANGGNLGSIDLTGLYKAPPFPPPDAVVTITATDSTIPQGPFMATATATIYYSDQSLKGAYAFSYQGNDASGFLAAAGSFNADGSGHITSGVEDEESFLTGISTQVGFVTPANSTYPGTYVVGPDGRVNVTINIPRGTETWQFVLTSNQHALMIRFNNNVTGSGTIDQQNVNDLANSNSAISGSYALTVEGTDAAHKPLGIGGTLSADGSGDIPQASIILDINDNSAVTTGNTDTSAIEDTYAFDPMFPSTGRGMLTITSNTTGTRHYAFYSLGNGTHLHLVETDSNAFVAGDAYSAVTTNSFSSSNYVFTVGGNSTAGAYAAGGVFLPGGKSGVIDSNSAGTVQLNKAIFSCPTTNPMTGRVDLLVYAGSGACPAGAGSIAEFAVYHTSAPKGLSLMLELDSTAVSTGAAYLQTTTAALSAGNFALNLAGQGLFYKSSASYQQNVEGAFTLSGFIGNLDINIFGDEPFEGDPISSTASSIAAPNATTGRGTASPASNAPFILDATNPDATYNLVYYTLDANTALLFDQDKGFQLTGILARQF